ncbi:MAG: TIGR02678 family protein [Bifidobacteriaceae bacterium]|nr:TIGR02678 family protein [Bifidobacteriaceae bacterium]
MANSDLDLTDRASAPRHADSSGGHYLPDAVLEANRAEFQRAARQILMTPLIGAAANPEGFRLVRGHLSELRDWFAHRTGWRLTHDSAVIRLNKQIVPTTPTGRAVASHHPARTPGRGNPFSARRYVLFCLAAAALERAEVQATLGDLAGAVVALAHERDLGGLTFTFETRDERSDLAQAIRLLISLGALRRVSGDEEAYVQAGGDAALYDVDRRVLARLLAVGDSPARVAARHGGGPVGIGQLESELHPAAPVYTERERNEAIRRRLTIQLLEDPVCYVDEMTEEEAVYFTRQRLAMTRRVAELTGLEPEVRAEGAAMTDRDDRLTDLRMPEVGTDGHAALLIAEHLASTRATAGVRLEELETLVAGWAKEYRSHWRASAREPGAAPGLAREAVAKLEALGLVRAEGEVVTALPAIRRFRFDRARLGGAQDLPQDAMFDLLGAAS